MCRKIRTSVHYCIDYLSLVSGIELPKQIIIDLLTGVDVVATLKYKPNLSQVWLSWLSPFVLIGMLRAVVLHSGTATITIRI